MDMILSRPTDHCYAPNLSLARVLALKNKIRIRAAETEESSSNILHSVMRSFPSGFAGELPRGDSLLRTISRQRQSGPLDSHNKLLDYMKLTDRGDDFLLNEGKDLVIYTTNAYLAVLKTYRHWFVDGTFTVRYHDFLDCCESMNTLGMSERILSNVHVARPVQISDASIGLWSSHRKQKRRVQALFRKSVGER
jgi:hypothetical protein